MTKVIVLRTINFEIGITSVLYKISITLLYAVKSYPSFLKEVRRMGQKQKRIRQNRATGLGKRTREEITIYNIYILIERWDQTDSPAIPDRGGETPEIPRPPFGDTHSMW